MSEVIVDVKDLEKQYKTQKVLNQVSFQIKKRQIVGLVGPNGAGKTTIMKTLGGLILPTSGSISLYGETSESGLADARSRMSFMIEVPYAKEKMSARENLEKQRLQKGIPDPKRVDEVLEIVGLQDTGKKHVKNFSLGMRQRLGIAIALLSKPELMVLDEPINGLDPEGIVEIRELLLKLNREQDITIVISSHILSELSLMCSDYIFLHHGVILKTLTAEQLKEECSESYHIHTDQDEKALSVLVKECGITKYDVLEDGSIRIFEKLDERHMISKTLYEHGLIPVELSMNAANLEEFYMSMVGGE